jgi:hypothetical protein
LFSFIFYHFQT